MNRYDIDDPETWQAYVDDALDADDRARIEAAMAADPALASRIAAARRVRDRVRGDFAAALDEPVPERFAALLSSSGTSTAASSEAMTPAASSSVGNNVRTLPARPRRFSGSAWALAAAASLAIVIGGLWWHAAMSPIRGEGADRFAAGALAQALDRRLSSAPAADDVAIGLTFRDRDAHWCRSFALQDAHLAGLACRDGERWRIVSLHAAPPSAEGGDEIRQAASAMPPDILQAIDARIDGDPLDAEQERAARDAGWR